MTGFLGKIEHKLKNVKALGVSNAWFIFKKRRKDLREYVNMVSPTEEEIKKMIADSRRRRTTFAVLLRSEGQMDEGKRAQTASVVGQVYGKFHLYNVQVPGGERISGEGKIPGDEKIAGNEKIPEIGKTEADCWNEAAAACKEDYLVFCMGGVCLAPAALWKLAVTIDNTRADLLYSDEILNGQKLFKPDFGIDTFMDQNFLGGMLCIRRETWEEMKGFDSNYAKGFLCDIILRMYESGRQIVHVPELLFSSENTGDSGAEKIGFQPEEKLIRIHREKLGMKDSPQGSPLVSILIPNKDHTEILDQCLRSILQKSTYDNYEILVIENNSEEQETFAYYEKLKSEKRVRVITCVTGWNYSYINNYGAKEAKGEYLLFLNNDTEVISPDWIEQMLIFAQRPDVGVVGAKLFYPDGTIQHGGVTLGIRAVAGHAFHGAPGDSPGYMNRLITTQNLSAVTAACMMAPAEVFRQVNGFDENYKVAFNDTDLCMRIREKGYLIVFNPKVQLYHYESKSRGNDEQSQEKLERFNRESLRFQRQWCRQLTMGDPYYNKNLSVWSDGFEEA